MSTPLFPSRIGYTDAAVSLIYYVNLYSIFFHVFIVVVIFILLLYYLVIFFSICLPIRQ